MKAAIVLNGDAPSKADMALLEGMETIVCADGAAQFMLKAGLVPTVIVGDLDSIESEVYKWADAMSVPLERHPKEKDYTDGELALHRALAAEPTELLILGGHGGRTAMIMANLKLLRQAQEAGADARMVGNHETIVFRHAGGYLDLTESRGQQFNVLPIGGQAKVTITGGAFSGEVTLMPASARGVSNVVAAEGPARVDVHEGMALIIVEQIPE